MLFQIYVYLNTLRHGLLNITPPPLRTLFLKLMLGKLGKGSVVDYFVHFRYPKKIFIGDHSIIHRESGFFPSYHIKKNKIVIGNHVGIGAYCRFLSAGHDESDIELRDMAADIVVDDYAWIQPGCTILQGVTVGEGSIVKNCSLVNKSIPPYEIWGGVPVKFIKKRVLMNR